MTQSENPKNKHLLSWLIILLFLASFCLALYPYVSDAVNQKHMSSAINTWKEQTAESSDADEKLIEQARAYNGQLESELFPFDPNPRLHEQYLQTLKTENSDLIGAVEIDSIDVHLPVYHGTEDTVLTKGIGHLEGSSIPLGDPGEHAILSGHSGLSNAQMFDHLDRLKPGDTFEIEIPGRKLIYTVSDIQTLLPSDFHNVVRNPDKCLATLVTCTPYGVNTHRLLVTGELTKTEDLTQTKAPSKKNENEKLQHSMPAWIAAAAILIVPAAFLFILNRKRKSAKQK